MKKNLLPGLSVLFFHRLLLAILVLAISSPIAAQGVADNQQKNNLVISGVVTDIDGQALVGVNVLVKGASIGTTTDTNGKYSLRVSAGSSVEYTYVGYESVTIAVRDQTAINVTLRESATKLDDVVVIGYGTVTKKDATGAVSTIRSSELNRGAVVSSTDLLVGKVSGLFVVPGDGGPGSGATLRIRNGSSLSASNSPMIIIDGLPISGDANVGQSNVLASINPNDIESYTVLKDASATAIYGSRASNGVIIITTKKGSGNKGLRVDYSSTYGATVNTDQVKVLSPSEFRKYMDEYYPINTVKGAEAHRMMNYRYPDGTVSEGFNTNWQDYIFQTGLSTDQNLSLSGGGAKYPFRISGGYTEEKGTLIGSNFRRFTQAFSFSPRFFDNHLSVEINAKAMQNHNNNVNNVVGNAATFDPTKPVYAYATPENDPDNLVKTSGQYSGGYFQWLNPDGSINRNGSQNPVSDLLENNYNYNDANRFTGNAQFDYSLHFLPELHAKINLGLDYSWQNGHSGNHPGSYSSFTDSILPPGQGRHSKSTGKRKNELLDMLLTYDKEVPSIASRFSVVGGYSWQHFFRDETSWTYSNATDQYPSDFLDGGYPSPKEYYLISFFGRLNYALNDRYLVTLTVRDDGTSRFGADNRWGLFPSAALGWRISEEKFLRNVENIQNLKLRVSYGLTGQQDIGTDYYPYIPQYNLSTGTSASQYYFGVPGEDGVRYQLLSPHAYNENIKWETTATFNAGLDFGFYRGRLEGSVEYFDKRTTDLLNSIPIAAGSNFTNQQTANIGVLTNRGVELNVNVVPIRQKNFSWDIGMNATWTESKIEKLTAVFNPDYLGVPTGGISMGTGNNIQIHSEGYAPNTFYVFEQVYDEFGRPIQNTFVDRDGSGVIDDRDLVRKHSPRPSVFFGFNMLFRYKRIDLGFNSHGSFDNWVFNDYNSARCSADYTFSNGQALRNVSRFVYYTTQFRDPITVQQAKSDLFLENASFWKLDNVTLGYSFHRLFGTQTRARVSFTAQNVLTVTKFTGTDPEVSNGIASTAWPRPKVFVLGLNVNF